MNKKTDMNNLNSDIMLDSLEVVGDFLVQIINESLSNGYFPASWKESTVIPVGKKPNTKNCEEFRPINSMPLHEKLMEYTVKSQLQKFILYNNLIVEDQSGFRPGYSCEAALNLIIADWIEKLDEGCVVLVVYLDLKRAFETIDRGRLLRKLYKFGIEGREQQWFKSYLTGRTQKTKFMNECSSQIENKLGVPQGSILGPLLFILYINDICQVVKHCVVKLFADDTSIYICGKNISQMVQQLNEDLNSIFNWLQHNKMKINISKTVYMEI